MQSERENVSNFSIMVVVNSWNPGGIPPIIDAVIQIILNRGAVPSNTIGRINSYLQLYNCFLK